MTVITAALLAAATGGRSYQVDPASGRNTFSAVFEAPLGERITAMSSQVACDLSVDAASGLASGTCAVPLTSVAVDNDSTKAHHFQEWATNKKTKPAQCRLEAKFDGVKLEGPLEEGKPAKFSGEVPFTVCGRSRDDGAKEHLEGMAQVLPAGEAQAPAPRTLRIRARIEKLNRDRYRIGPKYTEGWLARVQQLAPVVAEEGSIDFSLFAKEQTASPPSKGESTGAK